MLVIKIDLVFRFVKIYKDKVKVFSFMLMNECYIIIK